MSRPPSTGRSTAIASVAAHQVLDSRGEPTVEVDVTLTSGAAGRAAAPAGASKGELEAIELRDGEAAFEGRGVLRAVESVGRDIAPALGGVDASDQAAVDELLSRLDGTENKSRLGTNAVVATSVRSPAPPPATAACRRIAGWRAIPARRDGWRLHTRRLDGRVQLVGDDVFVTNERLLARGIEEGVANAIPIMLNQVGTVTETLDAIALARRHGYGTMISHRSGETGDTTIADLAVATGAGQIKSGAPSRGERIAKYNRLLRIEEELGGAASYAGWSPFER